MRAWLLLVLCWGSSVAFAMPLQAPPKFGVLGAVEGLPSSVVNKLAQDRDGYIWVGTSDGLARYDGVGFRVWRNDPADAGSLAANDVAALLVDRAGRLWCGGEASGLNRLDAASGTFEHYRHVANDARTLGSDDVWALAEDAAGAIWVGTYLGGLNRLEADGRFTRFDHDAEDPASLRSSTVLALHGDARGRLWIGTGEGLDVREPDGRIVHVALPALEAGPGPLLVLSFLPEADGGMLVGTRKGIARVGADLVSRGEAVPDLPVSAVSALAHDADGRLWIGTLSGLARIGVDGTQRYAPTDAQPGGLPGTRVMDILRDAEGGLWFALYDGGIARLPPHWRNFAVYRHEPDNAGSLSHGKVQALAIAADGAVWAASGGDGLDRIDPASGRVERWGERLGVHGGALWSVLVRDREVWLGRADGLRIHALDRTTTVELPVALERTDALPPGNVSRMLQAPDGRVWVGIRGGGIAVVDPATRAIRSYTAAARTLADADLLGLTLDAEGTPWVATASGVERYEAGHDRFRRIAGAPQEPVHALAFAADGSLWLHRLGALEHYAVQDTMLIPLERIDARAGWPAMTVGDVVVAADSHLWATSQRGLWRFDPATRGVRRFDIDDGLLSPEFTRAAFAVGRDGALYAGSLAGVVGFDPLAMRFDAPAPPLRVDRLSVRRGRDALALAATGTPLQLRHDDRDFSIAARALSYVNPRANHYRFRLAGFDSDWVDVDHRGERVYSQLPPGDYRLHLRAANADGVWNELDPPLAVRVAPPPWAAPGAFALYALALAGMIVAATRAYRTRIERRHLLALAEQRRGAAEHLAAAKSDFLATMSHEIRTPLTGVLGMAELLLGSGLDERRRRHAEAIRHSGQILLRLVNDSLDLARIEAGRLALEPAPFDPATLLHEIAQLQRPLIEARGLTLAVSVEPDLAWRTGDALRIEQVLLNLVSNALKFTERGGITLGVTTAVDGSLGFHIDDTGPGMSADLCARLFRRFEQADDSTARRHGGSGLGLAICRELVELMDGRICVESAPGQGSRFTVELPLPAVDGVAAGETAAPSASAPARNAVAEPRFNSALRILLVEDDATVAVVVAGLLKSLGHAVHHAPHALAALAEIAQGGIDLALLDLDLPGLDGLALARTIREGETDNRRLPLIALTARSAGNEETLCRAAGMDGFLRKPATAAMLAEAIEAALSGQIRGNRIARNAS